SDYPKHTRPEGRSVVRSHDHRALEPFTKSVNVTAGYTQSRQLNDRGLADVQQASKGELQEIDAGRRDVLAKLAGLHLKAELRKLVEQFGLDQVDLARVG